MATPNQPPEGYRLLNDNESVENRDIAFSEGSHRWEEIDSAVLFTIQAFDGDAKSRFKHRPARREILPMVCDLVNPASGKTYRQENLEKTHRIEIGSLVEIIDSGARMFVVHRGRDCDGTPLYWLAVSTDEDRTKVGGYDEEALRLIKSPED